MKQSEALQPLSRDHHQGLYVALELKRASAETAKAARQAFLDFFEREGSSHFRVEEEVLLPWYARELFPLVEEAMGDAELAELAAEIDRAEAGG